MVARKWGVVILLVVFVVLAGAATVQAKPATPAMLSPGSHNKYAAPVIGTLTPTLTWEAVPGISRYWVTVRPVGKKMYIWGVNVYDKTAVAIPANVLAPNQNYFWGIQAIDRQGNHSTAGVMYFTTFAQKKAGFR
ncbi:hypothetical protein [Anaeroselena agilis]|uniref:Fibronectin type-III domain-containing protein n=1 Tax=Anaeroselena agilis TaxID=3063788 RepID=A0ABU3P156_9FIRM|nr:hypothetical protein [Selenomonadales bacterium 4137-cl]